MNAQVRDAISGLQAAWSDTATTWTAATTNPTLGNGVLSNRVNRTGKSIAVNLTLVFGSTTTIGSGAYTFTLPVASVFSTTTYVNLGSASMRDTSASANRIGAAILTSPPPSKSLPLTAPRWGRLLRGRGLTTTFSASTSNMRQPDP